MKKLLLVAFLCFSMCVGNAATLTAGYTFSTTEQVTAAKLATLVNSATISSIASGDLASGAVGNLQLGGNAVTTDKILDATILTGDLFPRTLVSANFATNSITGIELNTNLTFRAGTLDFTLATITPNSISGTGVTGVTTSAGAADSGKIPKLDAAGKLNYSFINGSSVLTTNMSSATTTSSYVWTQIASLTTTATNGTVSVKGQALTFSGTTYAWARVRDSGSTVVGESTPGNIGGTTPLALSAGLHDTLSGTAKTYILEVATSGVNIVFTNTVAAAGTDPGHTKALGMTILQTP